MPAREALGIGLLSSIVWSATQAALGAALRGSDRVVDGDALVSPESASVARVLSRSVVPREDHLNLAARHRMCPAEKRAYGGHRAIPDRAMAPQLQERRASLRLLTSLVSRRPAPVHPQAPALDPSSSGLPPISKPRSTSVPEPEISSDQQRQRITRCPLRWCATGQPPLSGYAVVDPQEAGCGKGRLTCCGRKRPRRMPQDERYRTTPERSQGWPLTLRSWPTI
jgi:hypothetical protein